MPNYHPASKEFQEEAKRLGLTGYQLMQKYIKEGKVPDPADYNRKRNEEIAKRAGFKNHNEYERNRCHKNIERKREYTREWRYKNGIQSPMSENINCPHYLGVWTAERKYGRVILPEMFGGIEQEMPFGHPSYDFIVKGDIKIDFKSCCLRELKGWKGWEPHIRFNNITDYFVILAFDDRAQLNPIHIWSVPKDEIIRGQKLYNRESIKITNKTRQLLEFRRFDYIDKLKSLNDINIL